MTASGEVSGWALDDACLLQAAGMHCVLRVGPSSPAGRRGDLTPQALGGACVAQQHCTSTRGLHVQAPKAAPRSQGALVEWGGGSLYMACRPAGRGVVQHDTSGCAGMAVLGCLRGTVSPG